MDGNWLVQGLLANWLSELLVLAAGGLVTYLKRKNSSWLSPVLFGLGGCALMAVILFFGQNVISKREPEVTTENVEATIQKWLSYTTISVRNVSPEDPASIFALELTFEGGAKIAVNRPKAEDRYIFLSASVDVPSDQQKLFSELPAFDASEILSDVAIEMSRMRIQGQTRGLPRIVQLQKAWLIGNGMTEESFVDSATDMTNAVFLARTTFSRGMARYQKNKTTQQAGQR